MLFLVVIIIILIIFIVNVERELTLNHFVGVQTTNQLDQFFGGFLMFEKKHINFTNISSLFSLTSRSSSLMGLSSFSVAFHSFPVIGFTSGGYVLFGRTEVV